MRLPSLRVLVLALTFLGSSLAAHPARAADVDLNGAWKLVILAQLLESDLLLVDVTDHGGSLRATIKDSQPFPVKPEATRFTSKDGAVTLALKIGNVDAVFHGRPSGPASIPGVLKVAEQTIPARLDKTTDRKVAPGPTQPPEIFRDYMSARNEQLPKTRVRLLRAILKQRPGSPSLLPIYANILSDAEAAELSEADVRKVVTEWVDGARPYGDAYAAEVRTKAALALAGKPIYAPLALELARDADAALGADAPLQTRADVVQALADAARVAGNAPLAATAKAKADRLVSELDAEYHKKVPPFQPDATAGPKDRTSDRIALLELFTGAECPPCVAADVAFDALIQSYKPTQLLTLQYHLHIPGPDPLTSPDAQARSEYYPDFRGTPSPYFDGKSLAAGGGGMVNAEAKYREYRGVIDNELTEPGRATIDLKVDRKGDTVKIRASAEAKGGGSRLRLRMALVEEEVRYAGGNGLRFHHHVVRSMPGGVAGQILADGKGKIEATVELPDLRKKLEGYLADYAKEGNSFRRAFPPIPLARLSVVAFVQDDNDKSVLNAAVAPAGKAD